MRVTVPWRVVPAAKRQTFVGDWQGSSIVVGGGVGEGEWGGWGQRDQPRDLCLGSGCARRGGRRSSYRARGAHGNTPAHSKTGHRS